MIKDRRTWRNWNFK